MTFALLDDLLLAHERGRLTPVIVAPGDQVGPLVELLGSASGIDGITCQPTPHTRAVDEALKTRKAVYRSGRRFGVVSAARAANNDQDVHWDAFMFEMLKAMRSVGWPSLFARGFVGAMDEMQSNIHEHSGAAQTGVIAYRVTAPEVEWIVADSGIGILEGFQTGVYPSVDDAAEALTMALTDGCSRLGIKGRGNGFRQLFKALSARQGRLRFRSDDQLLTIAGVSPVLSRARLQQRAHVPGFSVNVVCARSPEAGEL